MTVGQAFKKYRTLGRVVRAYEVPLSVKLSAVVFENSGDTIDGGVQAISACADNLYAIALAVTDDPASALEAVSVAINDSVRNIKPPK